MRLSVKFSGAVLLLLLASLGCVAWLVIRHQSQRLHQRSLERSQLLLSLAEASREYTRESLAPAVRKAVAPHSVGLIFEAESAAFATRQTFASFHKRQPDYSLRQVALNPLNLDNRADDAERELIERFRSHPDKREINGYRVVNGREVFYVARPIVVEQSCLACHSSPSSAPLEVVERYGREHGYGWKAGEITAALIVTVPTDDIRAAQRGWMWTVVGVFAGVALLLVGLLHVLFDRLVNRRLKAIGALVDQVAEHPSADEPEKPLSEEGNDELAALSRGVNRMARAVYDSQQLLEHRVAERTMMLMQANQALGEEVRERRRAEAAARHAVDLAESASQAKSLFLANMSHEIRTPMNGILGMTDLALDTNLTGEQFEYLQTVKSSADSLLTILNDILDFSKIEAGKLNLDPIPFRLRDALGDTLKPLALRAHAKGLELAYRVDPVVPDAVIGDDGRLRQVIVNLVGNAIKFTTRGEVVVTVAPESPHPPTPSPKVGEGGPDIRLPPLPKVGEGGGGGEGSGRGGEGSGRGGEGSGRGGEGSGRGGEGNVTLRFSVKDTGIGISADKQKTIFEPFVQADSSTTRQYGGTGLGLSISARLVEMMGGKIEIHSVSGQGSTFTFTMVFSLQEEPSPVQQVPDGQRMRVLVVDDNSTCRDILLEMLSGWRLQATAVDRAELALDELEQASQRGQPYDLIIVDAHLSTPAERAAREGGERPNCGRDPSGARRTTPDGLDLLEEVRRRPHLARVTALLLSVAHQAGDTERCASIGLSQRLLKPVKSSELFDAIVRSLDARASQAISRTTPTAPLTDGAALTGKLRVLLAEDNAVNQRLAVRLLEKQGHSVHVVDNGAAAVESVVQETFDIVLMDVQMPIMGGYEATAAIRARESSTGRHLPIVAMTANAMSGDREACLAAGMDAYVAKPVQARQLFEVLAGVLVDCRCRTRS